MYRITAKKTNSNSINEYITNHHCYEDELAKYKLELEFVVNDPENVFRSNLSIDEGISVPVIIQAAKELLANLNKSKKDNPKIQSVIYRGLPCTYNENTKQFYFGFSCGLLKNVYIDPNEPFKERKFRSDLTKAKYYIRRSCMNWITICIDDETIIEKIL